MSTFGRSSSRKVTPPSASYMSNDQFANYLADLRNSRVARPGGARPLPPSGSGSRRDSGRMSIGSRVSIAGSAPPPAAASSASSADHTSTPIRPFSPASASSASTAPQRKSSEAPVLRGRPSIANHSVCGSVTSRYSTTGRGRDYIPDSTTAKNAPPPLLPDEVVPTDTYMERGQRWMEKEEAVSLRHALEDMDLKGQDAAPGAAVPAARPSSADPEDQRLYNAALDEAAELVWQHQNGIKPPEPGAPYQYTQHLRKNSYAYARTASVGRYGDDIEPTGLARDSGARSVSGSSASSAGSVSGTRRSRSAVSHRVTSGGSSSTGTGPDSARQSLDRTRASTTAALPSSASTATAAFPSLKGYKGLACGPRPMGSVSGTVSSSVSGSTPAPAAKSISAAAGRRRSSMKRNISGEIEKPFSGDQIYEEPETSTPEKRAQNASDGGSSSVLKQKAESIVNSKDGASPAGISKLVSRYEIHRNPPSQSRNPQYTTNQHAAPAPAAVQPSPDVPRKNGVEIRSDDIRQATSMKLKDRNPKLPTPSFVSDTPGRPIVSFDANWKAPVDDAATDTKPGARETMRHTGQGSASASASTTIPLTQTEKALDAKVGAVATPTKFQPKNIFARRKNTVSSAPVTPAADIRSQPAVAPQQYREQREQQEQQPPQQQQRPQARNIFNRRPAAQVKDAPAISVTEAPKALPLAPEKVAAPLAVPTITITDEPPMQTKPPSIPDITVSESPSVRRSGPPIPTISVSEAPSTRSQPPSIPTIVLPGDDNKPAPAPGVPSIVLTGTGAASAASKSAQPSVPAIVAPPASIPAIVTPTKAASPRPLPTPVPSPSTRATPSRPLPQPVTARPRSHWSRAPANPALSSAGSVSASRSTARCHECRQPIEGRFIALKGIPGADSKGSDGSERFHPHCFRCHTCGTSLEALEISPEPDAHRSKRLERIYRRSRGEMLEEKPGETMGEDGDDRLRFYCHLDWHEQFAPRCKHCTTPIVGEHVVALGEHWHVGHFFCAECGDPFGPGATHIEKDGYAWCVKCQTKRTERRAPKCRACGKAAIGQYVQALGVEWHDDCFRCAVCSGGFADGQIFPRQGNGGLMQVVCTPCRQRELKAW